MCPPNLVEIELPQEGQNLPRSFSFEVTLTSNGDLDLKGQGAIG